MRSFWLALQFLTRLPTPQVVNPNDKDFGQAIYHYPFVGFIIGFILFIITSTINTTLSAQTSNSLAIDFVAISVLICWVLITGALHLDGLADSADAWLGGYGNKSRTLEIMKDPNCGPAGVTALILLILIKFILIKLCLTHGIEYLIAAPLIARSSIQALFITTRYVRDDGLGSKMFKEVDKNKTLIGLAVVLGFISIYYPIQYVLLMIVFCSVAWWGMRRIMLNRIGGFTGDTAGAWIEITECVCLIPILWCGN